MLTAILKGPSKPSWSPGMISIVKFYIEISKQTKSNDKRLDKKPMYPFLFLAVIQVDSK